MTVADAVHDVKVALPAPMQLTVLGIVWRTERWMSLNAIHKAVCREYKEVALTTTSTIVLRMVEYGWLLRNRSRGQYTAGISREGLIDLIVEKIERAGRE